MEINSRFQLKRAQIIMKFFENQKYTHIIKAPLIKNLGITSKNWINKFFKLLTSSPYLHLPYMFQFLHNSVRNLCTYGVDGVKLVDSVKESKPLSVCPAISSTLDAFGSSDTMEGLKEVALAFRVIPFLGRLNKSIPLFGSDTLTF